MQDEKWAEVIAEFRSVSEADDWCNKHQEKDGYALDWTVERTGNVVRIVYRALADMLAIIFGRIKDSLPYASSQQCTYRPLAQ